MWKRKSTETIFEHPRITLAEDTVELPNGKESKYLRFADFGNVVTMIVRDGEGNFLLNHEYAYPPNQELWQFPEGFIEKGEDWEQAAAREIKEEAGIAVESIQKIGQMLVNHRRTAASHTVVVADGVTQIGAQPEETEQITNHWRSQAEIMSMITNGEIIQKNTLAVWSVFLAWCETQTS
jgi:ADP-ribose pyrophosphatase YjhB (NUDIX family)